MEQKKITTLIEESQRDGSILASFEIFPEDSLQIDSLDSANKYPSFVSIAWKVSNIALSNINMDNVDTIPAIELAHRVLDIGRTVLLHLTCIEMKKITLKYILDHLKAHSIKNLLVLQGDGFKESQDDGFNHVSDMIMYIRENYGDYFCLGIAGFPKGHPGSSSVQEYMEYLKYKVEVGADFIITQMFYDSVDFKNFVKHCKNIEINIPIIPGLCMFPSLNVLQRMTELTQLPIPNNLQELIVNVDDNEAFEGVMKSFIIKLINELMEDETNVLGIHWFTFNTFDGIVDILNIPVFNRCM